MATDLFGRSRRFLSRLRLRLHPFAVALLALALMLTPLFNALGYESSLASGVFVPLVIGFYWLRPWPLWKKVRGSLILLAIVPAALLVNMLFVRNCTYLEGLLFYVLAAGFGSLFAGAMAMAIRSFKVRWPRVLFVLIYIALLLAPVLTRLYTSPQIFFFNHLFGFYAGSIYDETIELDSRYVFFRLETVLWSVAFVIIALRFYLRRLQFAALLIFTLGSAGLLNLQSDSLGITSSTDIIHRELSPLTPNSVVIANRNMPPDRKARLEHRVRLELSDLCRIIGDSAMQLDVYVYPDAAMKKRFTGADETEFAKPWRREVHITEQSFESTIRHELVHVLFARHGERLFGISTSVGLIEGIADALETPGLDWTTDEQAAALFELNLAPQKAESILGGFGFLTGVIPANYTLMGSFVKFLLREHGIAKFKAVYAQGDFEKVYGQSPSVLVAAWTASLKKIIVPAELRRNVKARFDRKSIFQTECPHAVARLLREASRAASAQQYLTARDLYRDVLSMTSQKNPRALNGYLTARLNLAIDNHAELQQVIIEADSIAGTMAEPLPARFAVANAMLASGAYHMDSVRTRLSAIYQSHLSFGYDLAAAIRLAYLGSGLEGNYFSSRLSAEEKLHLLHTQHSEARLDSAKQPLLTLLIAERLYSRDDFSETVKLLRNLPPFAQPELEFERSLLWMRSALELSNDGQARLALAAAERAGTRCIGAAAKAQYVHHLTRLYENAGY
ncbi:MAG: hypothetical protein IAF08_09740 [Rhizobacter sp.]|nr:hypothetical protein [Chlorobiales bacterium]